MGATSVGCCASNAAGAGGSESLRSDYSEPQCTVCSEEEWIDSTEESLATSSTVHTDSSDSTPQTTEAPPLQRTQFDSWEDLESYLQQYSNDTYQVHFTTFVTVASQDSHYKWHNY
ncbi:hypothetical protein DVH05_014636 [Phytophthora capsici]|nr:hypothetical protein DVH05_014636 [Phytophthora capsici]